MTTPQLEHFRTLHRPGAPLLLVNAWDAGSARAVAEAGASAIATSSRRRRKRATHQYCY